MGNACCSGDRQEININTNVKNPDWADAIKTHNIVGVKILHATDPDVINEPIDKHGNCAIHFAVINKHQDLLDYLLKNGVNINAQGGKLRNTALHEAVINSDMKTVRDLFSFGIDDSISNIDGKRAIDICSKELKRQFTKAKQFRNKHREEITNKHIRDKTSNDIQIAGMKLSSTPTDRIKKYVKETDLQNHFYKNKKKEIEDRTMLITTFGQETGVEIDEIAMTLQKVPDSGKLWQKWAKKPKLTKQTEIYKMMFGLTVLTIKKKNPRGKKPPSKPIKLLTSRLCKKLPKRKGKTTLTKEDFIKNFHSHLYNIHDEMVYQEENTAINDHVEIK
eukprot:127625_1